MSFFYTLHQPYCRPGPSRTAEVEWSDTRLGEHGSNDTDMHLNELEIHPDDTTFSATTLSAAANSYPFKTSVYVAQAATKSSVGRLFSLIRAQPSGVLAVGDKTFNIPLDPVKVWLM